MEWSMHSSHTMACCVWKDKKSVILLSTNVVPIQNPCIHCDEIATVL